MYQGKRRDAETEESRLLYEIPISSHYSPDVPFTCTREGRYQKQRRGVKITRKQFTYYTELLHSNQSAIFSIQNKQKDFARAMKVNKFSLFDTTLIATEVEEQTSEKANDSQKGSW